MQEWGETMSKALNCALVKQVSDLKRFELNEAIERLRQGFFELTGEQPTVEQKLAWHGVWQNLQKVLPSLPDDVWVAFEYRLPMSNERIDVLLLGSDRDSKPVAIIGEFKGWRKVQSVRDWVVKADGQLHQHPEFQLLNYLGKVKNSHSAAGDFELLGLAWLYNLPRNDLNFREMPVFFASEFNEVKRFLNSRVTQGLNADWAKRFLEGKYVQSPHLFKAIHDNFDALRRGALEALCATGFAPSEEQHRLLVEILEELNKDRPIAFLIQGEPGSGKSYLAVLLLLETLRRARALGIGKQKIKEQNVAVLCYRNNRLLNTIRRVFTRVQPGLDTAIKFFRDIAKPDQELPVFQIAIFDEAQRLKREELQSAVQRGKKLVFLYDEGQRLNMEEVGTRENLIKAAQGAGCEVLERRLRGIYRVQGGRTYHDFVEKLINSPLELREPPVFPNYEFRIFADIEHMIGELREKASKGAQVALVAAFTESPGDRQDKIARSLLNLRVGYPLYSGWDHYRDKKLQIYWLMDERNQYPQFWYERESSNLTHCASIYGCQGFEADYVGVIWGRDFVWRKGRWTLGNNCEDTIGNPSLKKLFDRQDEANALPLLKNRYRIFLTRGIQGTYVYCEDKETAQLLKEIVRLTV